MKTKVLRYGFLWKFKHQEKGSESNKMTSVFCFFNNYVQLNILLA